MAEHRQLFVEGEVHRWVGAVNARPGGKRLLDMRLRHSPDPAGNPYLLVIGDHLLDSTINGVVDSAEYAAGALLSKIYREKHTGLGLQRLPSRPRNKEPISTSISTNTPVARNTIGPSRIIFAKNGRAT